MLIDNYELLIIACFHSIYSPAAFILTFLIPITIHYFLGEDLFRAINWNILRYTFGLHMVWLVNSGAHKWGMRPYDK